MTNKFTFTFFIHKANDIVERITKKKTYFMWKFIF